MLVLTRRVGETIVINDNIEVTILGISNHHIKVGIEAPANIPIHREELLLRLKDKNINNTQRKRSKKQEALEEEKEIINIAWEMDG